MAWQDHIALDVYISTAGDYVMAGVETQYPFEAGGTGGVPLGWTKIFNLNGAADSDVNWTTANGRFSISNASTTVDNKARYYGAWRDFPVKPYHDYVVRFQHRTMDNKIAGTFQNLNVQIPAGTGATYGVTTPNQSDWEKVSFPHAPGIGSDSTMRVTITMDYYGEGGKTDWGAQWTGFSIVETPRTMPEPTWHDCSCDVNRLGIRYGRERFTNRYDVATCNFTVVNNDGEYKYDPTGWLRPGRFVKVELREPPITTKYPQFYGIIDSITDGYTIDGKAASVISCVDMSSLMSNTTVGTVNNYTSNYNSGNRFYWLVKSFGWPSSRMSYALGEYSQTGINSNGRTIRDELGLGADSEGAWFWTDRSGKVFFRGRDWSDSTSTKVNAELLAMPHDGGALPVIDNYPNVVNCPIICTNELVTDWSRDRVVNEVSLANAGGSAVVFRDVESQQKYGPRTYQRHDFVNDNSHPEYLAERAADFMTGYTDAIQRVNRITWRPKPSLYNADIHFAYTVFLNWLVRVRYQHPTSGWGFSSVTHVQGIEHEWTVRDWTVSLALDEIEAFNFWDAPVGAIGWDQALWDVNLWDETDEDTVPLYGAYWNSGQVWNGDGVVWLSHGWGSAKWSTAEDDWKP